MSDTLPLSIQNNRRMEKWLRFQPDRTLRLAVGKVELGQGNVTALAQIAAEELDVDLDRITVLSGDTQDAPDEGQTTSSQSIEVSGRSVRLVTAEFRARVLDRLAQRLNCSPDEISVEDGAFRRGDTPTGHDYWNFAVGRGFRPRDRRHCDRRSRRLRIAWLASRCRGETCRPRSPARRSSTTWCGRTCCMRASCASHAAARRWRR